MAYARASKTTGQKIVRFVETSSSDARRAGGRAVKALGIEGMLHSSIRLSLKRNEPDHRRLMRKNDPRKYKRIGKAL